MFDPIVSSIGHIRAGQLRSAVEAKTKNEWLRARITRSNTKRKRPARAKARSSARISLCHDGDENKRSQGLPDPYTFTVRSDRPQ
jgi:hypothetical protein